MGIFQNCVLGPGIFPNYPLPNTPKKPFHMIRTGTGEIFNGNYCQKPFENLMGQVKSPKRE